MSSSRFDLLDFSQPSIRTLHLTWFAFFLSFVVWFSYAPLKPLIMASFAMTEDQWKALLTLNVALTIPARIVVGILVDKFGPRAVFSSLLFGAGVLCLAFASSQTFEQLALLRFLLGFVGAGFVIGIRMVGEWFPPRHVGLAEGIYGGWGNFGSAAAAFALPAVAISLFGGEAGWRYAIATTGVVAMIYGGIYLWRARNTPPGSTYFKPKKSGGLEVTSKRDFWFYVAMNVPMYAILALLARQLSPAGVGLLGDGATYAMYAVLAGLFVFQFSQIYRVNKEMLKNGVPKAEKYEFKQVAILDLAYFVTFGSELAVMSMLPAFFLETFDNVSLTLAGALGAAFAFTNLIARPAGGYISDRFGRRLSLSIFIAGLSAGYLLMSQISGSWPLLLALGAVMFCSCFVQAGAGAVFAMVPVVKRRMTGQIAGMVGAYGNVGAVTFLTIYSFVDATTFFMVIGGCAAAVVGVAQFLKEPAGHGAEAFDEASVRKVELG